MCRASNRPVLWILVGAASLAACAGTPTAQIDDATLARQTLVDFFADLRTGRYAQAVEAYAGTYETIIDHNPGQDPADRAGLFRSACTINGAQCLEVRSAELLPTLSAGEFRFAVEFKLDDGALFVLGPCCGGSEADSPPQSSFTFTVRKSPDGRFGVLDMPIYVP